MLDSKFIVPFLVAKRLVAVVAKIVLVFLDLALTLFSTFSCEEAGGGGGEDSVSLDLAVGLLGGGGGGGDEGGLSGLLGLLDQFGAFR